MEHVVIEPDKINWNAAKSMQEQMGHGMHNGPNSVLLEPGEKAEQCGHFQIMRTLNLPVTSPVTTSQEW